VEKDMKSAAQALADHMLKNGGDIVSIYHGEGATAEMAEALGEYINKKHPMVELEIYEGGQPLYSFILSVE
jgi:dihydroxyacetone kinase-like predicted kinase